MKHLLFTALLLAATTLTAAEVNEAPPGFTSLFNGNDLKGWRGGQTFDPRKLAALPEEQRTAQLAKWLEGMQQHTKVEGGQLISDGKGDYPTTEKEYGDFELLAQYKTGPLGDSGIYLRGCPQVQIWDHTNAKEFKNGADKGSGGLWNNSPGAPGKDPLVMADKPFGEWNQLRIIMTGARVTVYLNDQLTVNHALLENYYDRKTAVPARGPIALQTHGAEIDWRNLFIREIGSEEANKILREHSANDGFKAVFNGKDWTGWAGPVANYEIVDGAVRCLPQKDGTPHTVEEFGDFVARLEVKFPKGGNNGLALRYPGEGDTAYVGMCELQQLDDHYEESTGQKIDPRQANCSAYGMVAAQRGYSHSIGEWNYEEVTVKGSTIHVELNGSVILDCDLSKVDPATFMHGSAHPGKDRTKGSFGFAGHNDPVEFRNIEIKRLD